MTDFTQHLQFTSTFLGNWWINSKIWRQADVNTNHRKRVQNVEEVIKSLSGIITQLMRLFINSRYRLWSA